MRAMEAALPVQDLQVLAYGDLRGGEAVGQVLHQHSPVALDHFQDGATAFLVEHNFLVRRFRRAGSAAALVAPALSLRADVSSRPTGALPYLSFLFRTFPFGCPIKKCNVQPSRERQACVCPIRKPNWEIRKGGGWEFGRVLCARVGPKTARPPRRPGGFARTRQLLRRGCYVELRSTDAGRGEVVWRRVGQDGFSHRTARYASS